MTGSLFTLIVIDFICLSGIAFILGRARGRREADERKRRAKTMIFEVADDGHSATTSWTCVGQVSL